MELLFYSEAGRFGYIILPPSGYWPFAGGELLVFSLSSYLAVQFPAQVFVVFYLFGSQTANGECGFVVV